MGSALNWQEASIGRLSHLIDRRRSRRDTGSRWVMTIAAGSSRQRQLVGLADGVDRRCPGRRRSLWPPAICRRSRCRASRPGSSARPSAARGSRAGARAPRASRSAGASADVMTHPGLLGGAQQPRRAVHQRAALAVGGIHDHLDAVERAARPLPSLRSTACSGACRDRTRTACPRRSSSRRLGADGSGSTHDCDSHIPWTGQGHAT